MIGLIGINHKTATVDERAVFALQAEEAVMLIDDWRSTGYLRGAIALSTCNRVEIYYDTPHQSAEIVPMLERSLLDHLELSPRLRSKLFALDGEAMVRHLFRLTSGLESMVVGESQILGQVKDAFRLATGHAQSTPMLSRLFHKAFEAAKRTRSQYLLSAVPLSAGATAVDLVAQSAPSGWLECPTLVVGAGQMAETIVERLQTVGATDIRLYNRSRERAERFAERFGGVRLYAEGELAQALLISGVIFVATSASSPIILPEHLAERTEGVWVVDLAVPRNVDERVGSLHHTTLYSIDDLRSDDLHLHTQKLIAEAEQTLQEVIDEFIQWSEEAGLRQVIGLVQQASEHILQKELAHLPTTLSEEAQELVTHYDTHLRTTYATAIVTALKELTEQRQNPRYLEVVGELFAHIISKQTQ